MVFFALNPKSAKCINRSGVAYRWQPTHGGESGKDRLGSDVHAWCFRLRDNHLGRCRNITSHRPASRSAPGYVSTAHPRHHTHTIDHTVAVHSDVTAHTMALERGRAQAGDVRYEVWTPMHWRHSVRRGPGRATADGRRRPAPAPRAPRPAAPRSGACATPPASPLTPPLIHYLRTADRFQARSLCPLLHDDRSNLMPFLCPASNAIRLRWSCFRTSTTI